MSFSNRDSSSVVFTNEMIIILALVVLTVILAIVQILFIIFQKQIQELIDKRKKVNKQSKNVTEIMHFINDLASTLAKMSYDKIGALLVVENKDNLKKYIDLGKKVDVKFFPEFVTSVFYNHKSPLHDGAMIIRNLKIISLSSYLHMTSRIVDVQYGARHRAAFGICEYYDCFAFVVSETNGNITFSHRDEIRRLSQDPEELAGQITQIFSSLSIYKSQFKK